MKKSFNHRGDIRLGTKENELLKRSKCRDVREYQSPFRATLSMFKEYLGYTQPLSYDQWLLAPESHKAAVIYVQFFEQISLAWYKLRTDAAIEEDCVEEVIQYIQKNIPIIEGNESKFSKRYIYKIVYNCIYCKSIDPYKGQTAKTSWYNNTTSQYVQTSENELVNIFDTTSDESSDIELLLNSERFWSIIEDMGSDTLSVVSRLLGDGIDPNHRVTRARQAEIIEELKVRLAPFKEVYYI